MISLEQARRYYPPERCPSDSELWRILATMYALANREWDLMMQGDTDAHGDRTVE